MQRSRGTIFLVAVAAIAVAALGMNVAQMVRAVDGGSAGAPSVPSVMSYQGLLTDPDTGQAVADGTYNMSFIIFDAAVAGTALWEEPAVGSIAVDVSGGLFTHLLGSDVPLTPFVFSSGDTYLQVFVNGEMLSPRQPVTTVAYALVAQQAATASSIDGISLDGLDNRFVNSRGGDFPRPNYDSGFQAIAVDEVLSFTHDLGGNIDDYVVDLTCDAFFEGQFNWGTDQGADDLPDRGVGWFALNGSSISVRRGDIDAWCVDVRVRIWVMPPVFFLPPIIILP
ncbi:MAG: hypothetical protein IH866_02825 [Chloroflexi bacterium]|nr:hypothetical protein [Chloroflexota bacterium]